MAWQIVLHRRSKGAGIIAGVGLLYCRFARCGNDFNFIGSRLSVLHAKAALCNALVRAPADFAKAAVQTPGEESEEKAKCFMSSLRDFGSRWSPAFQKLAGRLKSVPTRGVIITSPSEDPQYDFVSRFFAPAVGIDEDPVTGSAHCCLGPYWAKTLGKTTMTAYQASARGGFVSVKVQGDRVLLGGQAVTVLRGELV